MELTNEEELNSAGKESFLRSYNCPSTNELHSVQSTSGVRMEEADKCNHFTIRGYVAEARKKDAKLCWPLFVSQDQTTPVVADSLPPLVVSKFRRWNCLNCVQSITGDVMRDTEVMRENELNNLFSGCNQSSAYKDLGERVVEAHSSIIANHGKTTQELPHSEKIEIKNVMEEGSSQVPFSGSQISRSDCLRSQENQGQSINLATEDVKSLQAEESLMTKGKTARRTDPEISMTCAKQNAKLSTTAYKSAELSDRTLACENGRKKDCNGFRTKCKTKSLSNDEIQESSKIVSVDMKTSNKDIAPIRLSHGFNYEQVVRDQRNENTAPGNIHISVDLSGKQDNETEVGLFNQKPGHKKVRKKRSLKDILKSGESYVSKKVKVLNREAGFIETNKKNEPLCGSELKAQYSGSKDLVVSQNSQAQLTEAAFNISTVDQSKDEEPSLMHWLKELSKKAKNVTERTEIKHIEKGSWTSVDAFTKLGSEVKGLGKSRTKRQKKNCQAPCLVPQQENMGSEDKLTKIIHPKNAPLKVRLKFTKNNQSLGGLEWSHHKKTNFRKEKNKVPRSKIQNPFKKYLSNKGDNEKQRGTKIRGTENEDDIPMDIVELLAKNQHERHLTATKVTSASKCTMPMVNENLKHDKSCTAGNCETDVWNTLNRSQHMVNDAGHCLHNAIRNQDPGCELETVKLHEHRKHNLHFDLNQQATDFQTTPDCSGHQCLRADIPASDSSKLYYPSMHEVNAQSIEFRERGQAVSSQTLSRNCFSGFLPLAFEYNKTDYGAHHYARTNLGVVYKETNQMALGLRYDEVVNPIGSQVLNAGGKAVALANRGNLSYGPLMLDQESGCLKPMALTGSRSNETLSATHLLRLAGQTALSRGSLDRNHTSYMNQNYNAQTSGVPILQSGINGFHNQESIKGLWDAGFLHQGKDLGVSCKPHRPVPRLGVLGPFLQKEIMTNPSMCRAPLGMEPLYSSEFLPPQTNQMEKASSNCLFSHFPHGNIQPAVIKERNTKHVLPAHSICMASSLCHDNCQVETREMENAAQSVQYSCMTEKCVVNRNPADFTLIEENNIYMIGD